MGIKRSYGYCKLASLRMRVCECQGTLAGFSRGDVEGAEGAKSARGVQPTHVFLCSLCMWPDGSSRFALFVECLSVKNIYVSCFGSNLVSSLLLRLSVPFPKSVWDIA